MPAEAADQPDRPPHPLHEMTTYELRDYRKQLERALKDGVTGQAPTAARLREQLAAVLAEEQDRQRLADAR
jgi:hypothetical protein